MTDDEQAIAAVELLAGIRRCDRCRKPAPHPDGRSAARLLDPPGGPFLCPICWWDTRGDVTSTFHSHRGFLSDHD